MNGGIPEISRDGIPTVSVIDLLEVVGYFVKSFVPADGLPTLRGTAHGLSEPVFVVVNILQPNRFGADVSTAEWIFVVAANVQLLI